MANTFKNLKSRAIGTAATAVGAYTVPSNTQITVIGLSISNITSSNISASATIYDGTNSTYLIKDAPILSGSTLVVVGGEQKVVLLPGESIRVVTNTASSVDVVMSVLEIT